MISNVLGKACYSASLSMLLLLGACFASEHQLIQEGEVLDLHGKYRCALGTDERNRPISLKIMNLKSGKNVYLVELVKAKYVAKFSKKKDGIHIAQFKKHQSKSGKYLYSYWKIDGQNFRILLPFKWRDRPQRKVARKSGVRIEDYLREEPIEKYFLAITGEAEKIRNFVFDYPVVGKLFISCKPQQQ